MSEGIGIANLPNQVCMFLRRVYLHLKHLVQKHKIVAKRGAHFTIMVVGQSRHPLLIILHALTFEQVNLVWGKPHSLTPCSPPNCLPQRTTTAVTSSNLTS